MDNLYFAGDIDYKLFVNYGIGDNRNRYLDPKKRKYPKFHRCKKISKITIDLKKHFYYDKSLKKWALIGCRKHLKDMDIKVEIID